MAKPIVIVTTEAEREALRTGGVLPEGVFRTFGLDPAGEDGEQSSLYLWPYTITYALSEDWANRVEERPVELAVFLGMDESADDEQMRARDVEVTRLLGSTVVHIVFLDKREGTRGYAVFRSFKEIAEWSRQFKAVLDVHFRNEPMLQQTENVLVIVARGAQVRVSKEELEAFNACVGETACFRSCYFLDYSLSVADTHELFHSHTVWDVMVGRLLLGFLLSRERDQVPVWQRGGVRLWRSEECWAHISDEFCQGQVTEALSKAYDLLPNMVDDEAARDPLVYGKPSADFLPPQLEAPSCGGARDLPASGWSDFEAVGCWRETASSKRWLAVFRQIKEQVGRDDAKQSVEPGDSEEARKVFSRVHQSPGLLFKQSAAVGGALGEERAELRAEQAEGADGKWRCVVDAEANRQRTLEELNQAALALAQAQRHYVGWGVGAIVVLAISAMCGFLFCNIVRGLTGSVFYAVWLAGATLLGALSALLLVMRLHGKAGLEGVAALIGISVEADKNMIARDGHARAMIGDAKSLRLQLWRQNARFRMWMLLQRIQSVLITEIQPKAPHVEAMAADSHPGDDSSTDAKRRDAFIKLTRHVLGGLRQEMAGGGHDKLKAVFDEWWESPAGENSFKALWTRLCEAHDKQMAGHFPARVFIPAIRSFVTRFKERVHREVVLQSLLEEHNLQEVNEALKGWVKKARDGNSRQFCSAAITGLHDREDDQESRKIFVRNERTDLHLNELTALAGGTAKAVLVPCETLKKVELLAFLYQEFNVEFDVDPANSLLMFKEVPDVK